VPRHQAHLLRRLVQQHRPTRSHQAAPVQPHLGDPGGPRRIHDVEQERAVGRPGACEDLGQGVRGSRRDRRDHDAGPGHRIDPAVPAHHLRGDAHPVGSQDDGARPARRAGQDGRLGEPEFSESREGGRCGCPGAEDHRGSPDTTPARHLAQRGDHSVDVGVGAHEHPACADRLQEHGVHGPDRLRERLHVVHEP